MVQPSKLQLKRVYARWVSRFHQPEQKATRVQIYRTSRYAEKGNAFLNSIVTCDETWFHFFGPEMKQHSSVYKHALSLSSVKTRLSVSKVMAIIFCNIT